MVDFVTALMLRARRSGQRAAQAAVLYAIVALLLLSAYVFAIIAAAIHLSDRFGAAAAASMIAAGFLLLGLVVLAFARIRIRRLRRKAARHRAPIGPSPGAAVTATLLPLMVKSSPVGALFAIAAVTYVLSRSTFKRR